MARIFDASQVIFVDCDDCLYQNNWATAAKITTSIAAYTANLGVSEEKAYALYKTHGTCLKGMLAEGLIAADAAEDFLLKVHEIDYSDVLPDPPLAAVLGRLAVPAWIFTASTKVRLTPHPHPNPHSHPRPHPRPRPRPRPIPALG